MDFALQSEGNRFEDNKGRDQAINERRSGGIEGALTTKAQAPWPR